MSRNTNYRHPIYGVKQRVVVKPKAKVVSSVPYCYDPCPGILDAFLALESAIFNTERALQQYYEPARAVSEFVAKMSARCTVPPVIFVRLVWRNSFPKEVFDITNPINRLQIKDIYLAFGFDYTGDPLFKDALGKTLI